MGIWSSCLFSNIGVLNEKGTQLSPKGVCLVSTSPGFDLQHLMNRVCHPSTRGRDGGIRCLSSSLSVSGQVEIHETMSQNKQASKPSWRPVVRIHCQLCEIRVEITMQMEL